MTVAPCGGEWLIDNSLSLMYIVACGMYMWCPAACALSPLFMDCTGIEPLQRFRIVDECLNNAYVSLSSNLQLCFDNHLYQYFHNNKHRQFP